MCISCHFTPLQKDNIMDFVSDKEFFKINKSLICSLILVAFVHHSLLSYTNLSNLLLQSILLTLSICFKFPSKLNSALGQPNSMLPVRL